MSISQSMRSVWSLRVGILLALLPIPAFAASLAYALVATRHAARMPEDYWPLFGAGLFVFGFTSACLVPSILLLLLHLRQSQVARWAFGLALAEALALGTCVVYANAVA